MTQEGKPLPSGKRLLGHTASPCSYLIPPPTAGGTEGHHLAQEWRSAVPLANCLKKEDQGCKSEGVESKGKCHHEESMRNL